MKSYSRLVLGQLVAILGAGISLGAGLTSVSLEEISAKITLLGAAAAGEWLEVQLGQVGRFTLRPVIAFVSLWNGGPALFMLTGLLPVFLMRWVVKRTSLLDAMLAMGRESAGLWIGYLTYLALARVFHDQMGSVAAVSYLVRAVSLLVYWVVQIPLQAVERHLGEGIRYLVVLEGLARRFYLHGLALTAVGAFLSYVLSDFGALPMVLTTVVLIEAYYPYKLLGEQSGVLLTSLQMMAQAVDLKDPYTSNHSQRVSRYAVRIARAMGLPEDEVERIRIGALMHDIGKIGISGRIIRKPGKLDNGERALMMQHSSVSADIIQPLEILGESAEMVRYHHEHCDGSGYPDGLSRERIPLGSRIILVADAYDALTTDRPYRRGASKEQAIGVIQGSTGTQFDPDVVEALKRVSDVL